MSFPILTMMTWVKYYYYPYLIYKETETQRDYETPKFSLPENDPVKGHWDSLSPSGKKERKGRNKERKRGKNDTAFFPKLSGSRAKSLNYTLFNFKNSVGFKEAQDIGLYALGKLKTLSEQKSTLSWRVRGIRWRKRSWWMSWVKSGLGQKWTWCGWSKGLKWNTWKIRLQS